MQIATIVLALGANKAGAWGPPMATILRACNEIERLGVTIASRSELIVTKPVGPARQARYHNLAIRLAGFFSLMSFLHRLQSIEKAAGRRIRPRWSARELDIDIICAGGRVVPYLKSHQFRAPGVVRFARASGAPTRHPGPRGTKSARIQLPHPEMAVRSFVLAPMVEVAPHWRHPFSGLTPRQMLLQLKVRRPRRVT